jgi:hypothetical protein
MPIIVGGTSAGPGAITDYDSLVQTVADWLHRDNSPADLGPFVTTFVQLAQERIYRELRVAEMEETFSSTMSAGVIAVPTGYIELKNAYLDGSPVQLLKRKDVEWIYRNYPTRSSDSAPKFIAREKTNFIFGPYPDSDYTVKGTYYKQLDFLSGSNPTNWLITDAPSLLLFASLCEAEPYLQNDPRIAVWETKYQTTRDRIQNADNAEEFSGGPLSITGG